MTKCTTSRKVITDPRTLLQLIGHRALEGLLPKIPRQYPLPNTVYVDHSVRGWVQRRKLRALYNYKEVKGDNCSYETTHDHEFPYEKVMSGPEEESSELVIELAKCWEGK